MCHRSSALVKHSYPLSNYRVRSIFIDSESTPNPNSMKFMPGCEVLPSSRHRNVFQNKDRREMKSPLATDLFKVNGVKGIFLGRDFVTVTKISDESWQVLKPQILVSYLTLWVVESLLFLVDSDIPISDTEILDTDSEVVATIKELLRQESGQLCRKMEVTSTMRGSMTSRALCISD